MRRSGSESRRTEPAPALPIPSERTYEIPEPGRYIFLVKGLEAPGPADPDHGIVFMRPCLAPIVACATGIVLARFMLIGSLVLFRYRLTAGGGMT